MPPPTLSPSLTPWLWRFPSVELPCAVTLVHLLLRRLVVLGCALIVAMTGRRFRDSRLGPSHTPDAGDETVLIAGFPAGPWGTNCYVAATGAGNECVVIDPGKDATEGVTQVVREHKLKPVAVLVTHGHVDHMWCVAPVAGTYDATAWIHPDDRHLLANPMAGMSQETTAMLLGGQYEFAEPDRVEELADAQTLELAGLEFVVDHTPGHTEGSVTFRSPYAEQGISEVMFSGDLLFAGSIGRTDLPGGD